MKTPFKKIEKCGLFYVTCDDAPFSTVSPGTTERDAERLVNKLNKAYEMGYLDYNAELGEDKKRLNTCKDCRTLCTHRGSSEKACKGYL